LVSCLGVGASIVDTHAIRVRSAKVLYAVDGIINIVQAHILYLDVFHDISPVGWSIIEGHVVTSQPISLRRLVIISGWA